MNHIHLRNALLAGALAAVFLFGLVSIASAIEPPAIFEKSRDQQYRDNLLRNATGVCSMAVISFSGEAAR